MGTIERKIEQLSDLSSGNLGKIEKNEDYSIGRDAELGRDLRLLVKKVEKLEQHGTSTFRSAMASEERLRQIEQKLRVLNQKNSRKYDLLQKEHHAAFNLNEDLERMLIQRDGDMDNLTRLHAEKVQVWEQENAEWRESRLELEQKLAGYEVQIETLNQSCSAKVASLEAESSKLRSHVLELKEELAKAALDLENSGQSFSQKVAVLEKKNAEWRGYYNASKTSYYVGKQVAFAQAAEKLGEKVKADCYVCLLPETTEVGFALKRNFGGTVICDNVENIRADSHTAKPNCHPSALNLAVNASQGALFQCDKHLTIGDEIYKSLQRFERPTMVMENFRNFEVVRRNNSLRRQLGLGEDAVLLFTCGSVIEGMGRVIKGLAKLPSNFHLVGFSRFVYKDYETKIMDLIKTRKLEGRVHFMGFVPYKELAKKSSSCDIGLITNDVSNPNAAVGFPNRFFDYLAANLPVISTPMPDVKRCIQDFELGAVIESNSASKWASAIDAVHSRLENHRKNVIAAKREMSWEQKEEEFYDFLGRPKSVTFVSYRNLFGYQRFIRMARTLRKHDCNVNFLFTLKDAKFDQCLHGVKYYCVDNLYTDDAPIRIH